MLQLYDEIIYLQIISARHLMKSGRGIVSPFVEIEIAGTDYDATKCKTNTIGKTS